MLERPLSGAFGWVLTAAGHAVVWPVSRSGSQVIAGALASYFRSLGGVIVTNTAVRSIDELRDRELILFDVTPRQLVDIAGDRMPDAYCRKLREYRYGMGVFKMDWALDGPVPWKTGECARMATVHVGGSMEEIARLSSLPGPACLILHAPPLESTRPRRIATYLPNGSTEDMSDRIKAQIERFAPGFRARILARSGRRTADLERYNANLQGGDIGGGAVTIGQFLFRPARSLYRTPVRGLYLCSASTPPGGGVLGMCGYRAPDARWPTAV